jgi:UDP-N-acetylglucosamine pyrophosphorylase
LDGFGATDVQKNDTRGKLLVLLDRKISLATTSTEKEEMRNYILHTAKTLYDTKSGMLLVYECLIEYSDIPDPLEFDVSIFKQFRECNTESIPFHQLATAFITWNEDKDTSVAVSSLSVSSCLLIF